MTRSKLWGLILHINFTEFNKDTQPVGSIIIIVFWIILIMFRTLFSSVTFHFLLYLFVFFFQWLPWRLCFIYFTFHSLLRVKAQLLHTKQTLKPWRSFLPPTFSRQQSQLGLGYNFRFIFSITVQPNFLSFANCLMSKICQPLSGNGSETCEGTVPVSVLFSHPSLSCFVL